MASSDDRLIRIQALSGATFLVFVVAHLANTSLAAGGAEAYDGFQRAARGVYQLPLVEILLVLAPLAVHFAAAITRLRRSGFRRGPQPIRTQLHRFTGYFLLVVILGHLFATRGSDLFFDAAPGFGGLSFSLWWMPWMFYPYYLLLALCGLYHGAHGLLIALGTFGVRLPAGLHKGPGFWVPVGLVAAALIVAVLKIGGHLGDVPDPRDNDYARLYESWGLVDLSD
jgi:succinate dehydrogenase/fumarate reductase cytochrome b subunit